MKLVGVFTLLLVSVFIFAVESQNKPDWCSKGYQKQTDGKYTICSQDLNAHEQSTTRSSW
jgi:hypothetical protein